MSDSNNQHDLPSKKPKVIVPASASDDPDLQKAHDDMLQKLQKQTDELTKNVGGVDEARQRILEIESSNPEVAKDLNAPKYQPEKSSKKAADSQAAAEVVRAKLNKIFEGEPSAQAEAEEVENIPKKDQSRHQKFISELRDSGKSIAEVQTAWHEYYQALDDQEKHQVWQEFYENQSVTKPFHAGAQSKSGEIKSKLPSEALAVHSGQNPLAQNTISARTMPTKSGKTAAKIKQGIQNTARAAASPRGQKLSAWQHAKSLLVGLGLAALVGGLFMFTFFNEAFIAPFISPSKNVSATPIIGNETTVSEDPKVIIPKINVEVPVVYDVRTIEEDAIQAGLERGVVHYATTPFPGENGNGVIVGHSSNNILNSGQYKFAFVLLRKMEIGDLFYLNFEGKRYTYKIYEKTVVPPTDVSVLGPAERDNSFTLITCDPPGTSTNRLIVVGEQISPDPSSNTEASNDYQAPLDETAESEEEEIVPGNAPSLWSRLWPF